MDRPDNTEIIDRFLEFYRTYCADDINQLAQAYPDDRRSLYIDWEELYRFDRDMAEDYTAKPGQMRDYAEEALRLYDLPVDVALGSAHVRFTGLPDEETVTPAGLRAEHQGRFIAVDGTIASIGGARTRPVEVAYECPKCGMLNYIPNHDRRGLSDAPDPDQCGGCESKNPGYTINHERTEYRDFQTVVLGHDPADGGDTESIEVRLTDDIVGSLNAGATVRVAGVVRPVEEGTPVKHASITDRVLVPESVEVRADPHDRVALSDEQKRAIIELSNSSDIYEQLVGSLAPSVPGHEDLKLAVILQLFGGVPKHLPDKTRVRGDIHTLAIGGDETSLGRIASAASRLAPRGAEADVTGETLVTADSDYVQARSAYRYRAGVLPRLDPDGFASLIGFTQAPTETQEAIADVLRGQAATVSERDAERTMPARASVLATGAPKYGDWDEYEAIMEQTGVNASALPAFDLAFAISDTPDDAEPVADAVQAGGMAAHKARVPTSAVSYQEVDAAAAGAEPAIGADLLQHYIAHARRSCLPTVTDEARETITDFYEGLSETDLALGNLPATVNDLAAVVRLAEASARARLADTVEPHDAERAISLIRASMASMGAELPSDDAAGADAPSGQAPDMVSTRTAGSRVDGIKAIIAELEAERESSAPIDEVVERAVENGADREAAEEEVEKLIEVDGEAYEPTTGKIRLVNSEDPEDVVQREHIRSLNGVIEGLEDDYEEGAPVDEVISVAQANAIGRDVAEHEIEKLKQRGEVYEPSQGHLRTT